MRLPNSPSNCWTRFGVGWVLDSTSQEFARNQCLDAYSPWGLGANPKKTQELGVKTRPCFVGKASYGYVWRRWLRWSNLIFLMFKHIVSWLKGEDVIVHVFNDCCLIHVCLVHQEYPGTSSDAWIVYSAYWYLLGGAAIVLWWFISNLSNRVYRHVSWNIGNFSTSLGASERPPKGVPKSSP